MLIARFVVLGFFGLASLTVGVQAASGEGGLPALGEARLGGWIHPPATGIQIEASAHADSPLGKIVDWYRRKDKAVWITAIYRMPVRPGHFTSEIRIPPKQYHHVAGFWCFGDPRVATPEASKAPSWLPTHIGNNPRRFRCKEAAHRLNFRIDPEGTGQHLYLVCLARQPGVPWRLRLDSPGTDDATVKDATGWPDCPDSRPHLWGRVYTHIKYILRGPAPAAARTRHEARIVKPGKQRYSQLQSVAFEVPAGKIAHRFRGGATLQPDLNDGSFVIFHAVQGRREKAWERVRQGVDFERGRQGHRRGALRDVLVPLADLRLGAGAYRLVANGKIGARCWIEYELADAATPVPVPKGPVSAHTVRAKIVKVTGSAQPESTQFQVLAGSVAFGFHNNALNPASVSAGGFRVLRHGFTGAREVVFARSGRDPASLRDSPVPLGQLRLRPGWYTLVPDGKPGAIVELAYRLRAP